MSSAKELKPQVIDPADHLGLIYNEATRIRKLIHTDICFEEVLSELYIVLDAASRAYKSSKGYKPSTYILACIRTSQWQIVQQLIDGKRITVKGKIDFQRSQISLQEKWMQPAADHQDHNMIDDMDLLDFAKTKCDELDSEFAVENITNGVVLKELGIKHGLSKERIRQRRNQAISDMREAAEAEVA